MTKVVCIIQARRGSSRLPDKVLLPLGKKTILTHVIERCKAINSVDEVVLATTDDPYEDVLAEFAINEGISVYRGSENDVLDRYYQAATIAQADYVMRVTSDCPLLDPQVCDALVNKVIHEGTDYGGTGAFPHGLDCEVFTMSSLQEAHNKAESPEDREHVTLWMKRNADVSKSILQPEGDDNYSKFRWTVDYPEDYEFLKALEGACDRALITLSYKEVVTIVRDNEALSQINGAKISEWAKATAAIIKVD